MSNELPIPPSNDPPDNAADPDPILSSDELWQRYNAHTQQYIKQADDKTTNADELYRLTHIAMEENNRERYRLGILSNALGSYIWNRNRIASEEAHQIAKDGK